MSGTPAKRRTRVPLRATSERQRMWNCIVQLRRFTQADVVATAEADRQHVSKYVSRLVGASYVREVQRQRGPGSPAVYQLQIENGPHAPRFSEDGTVLDPNLEPQHLPPEARPVMVPRAEYERALRCVRACAGMQDPELEVQQLRNMAQGCI